MPALSFSNCNSGRYYESLVHVTKLPYKLTTAHQLWYVLGRFVAVSIKL